MPFLGLGLHVIVAIFFAIHALRFGRPLYWLIILFMFPLLGSVVYFAAVFMPDARLWRGVRRAGGAIDRALQPERAVREARAVFEATPTAANRVALASALMASGDAEQIAEAVRHYDACLAGPFAGDAELQLGAARARLANAQPGQAIGMLVTLRAAQPGFRPEQVGLSLAEAYAAAGRNAEAGEEYQALVERFGSIDARAGLALWALANNRRELAERELREVELVRKRMNKHARSQYQALFARLDAAARR